jgi:hypothetical protein
VTGAAAQGTKAGGHKNDGKRKTNARRGIKTTVLSRATESIDPALDVPHTSTAGSM